jgi:hypothetical protein
MEVSMEEQEERKKSRKNVIQIAVARPSCLVLVL